MELIERRRRMLVAIAATLVALSVLALGELLRIERWNALMTSPAIIAAPENAPPDVRIAQAQALAARGQFWAALSLYRQIIGSGNPASRATASFNEGNLLLREAIALHAAGDAARAQPLLQLAKESYRQVLREHPMEWDAKCNLELALRWASESDEEEQAESPDPIVVRHATVIQRGMVQGLP
jgi:mxaK protein